MKRYGQRHIMIWLYASWQDEKMEQALFARIGLTLISANVAGNW